MKILIRCPINRSGFGVLFSSMIKSFNDMEEVERILIVEQGKEIPQGVNYKEWILFDCRLASLWGDFEKPWKLRVGYSMLETDRISPEWMKNCNRMDLIIVPTKFNVDTYRHSGVIVPIVDILPGNVYRHIYSNSINKTLTSGTYKFLACGQWVPFQKSRKGWEELIITFVKNFGRKDNVELILKPNLNFGKQEGFRKIISMIIEDTGCKDLPKITLIDNQYMGESQITQLFESSDCYVQPSHGEGLGLDFIRAMNTGMDIITTDWSSLQYLCKDYPKIHFIPVSKLENCPDEIPQWSANAIDKNHKWAKIDIISLGENMIELFYKNDRKKIDFKMDTTFSHTKTLLKWLSTEPIKILKTTLFIMPMSLGDLLEVSSVIKKYHEKYPKETLTLMCKRKYQWLFQGCKYINVIDYPEPFYYDMNYLDRDIKSYSFHKWYAKVIELNSYTQIYTDWCKANLFPNKITRREHYYNLAGIKYDAKDMPFFPKFKKEKNDYVLIHPYPASDKGRIWNKWDDLVADLKKLGYKYIAQIGAKTDVLLKGVIDKRGISYIDLLKIISGCRYFIGCDSFCLHLAGALNKKGVALFGNTNVDFAMSWKGKIHPIIAKRNCIDSYPCHEGFCKVEERCINNIEVGEILACLKASKGEK